MIILIPVQGTQISVNDREEIIKQMQDNKEHWSMKGLSCYDN